MRLPLAALLVVALTACGGALSADEFASAPSGRIAFAVNRDGWNEIWTMNGDGSGRRRLTRGPAPSDASGNQNPAWSPTGRRIAYVSSGAASRENSNDLEIYAMDYDGRRKRRLTFNAQPDLQPTWSPDGHKILFVRQSTRSRPAAALYTMDRDGRNQQVLRREPMPQRGAVFLSQPAWSPNGTIAYLRFSFDDDATASLYAINADGTNPRKLADDAFEPAWSPDGSRIAFVSDRDHTGRCLFHDCEGFAPEVYVMRSDGTEVRRITHSPATDVNPAWSPDGKRIAFARITNENSDYEIYSIRPDGIGLRQLTNNRVWDYQPAWSRR